MYYNTYDLLTKELPESEQITLQRTGRTGKNNWAIRKGYPRLINNEWSEYKELSKKGTWDEPQHPAGMTRTYIKNHRWDDPNDAYRFWIEYNSKSKKNTK
jgi:hypothetical protein